MKSLLTLAVLLLVTMPAMTEAARRSPVDGGSLTSGPGFRIDPFGSGRTVWHNGWDIAVPNGTPVYPTQEGTVYFAGIYKGYGNLVAVLHGKGNITLYGHNSEILVKPGEFVDTKTVIARSGNTGRSTGPHVHYEVRQLPGYSEKRQAELEQNLRSLVMERVDEVVENHLSGRGGESEAPQLLPEDIDQ